MGARHRTKTNKTKTKYRQLKDEPYKNKEELNADAREGLAVPVYKSRVRKITKSILKGKDHCHLRHRKKSTSHNYFTKWRSGNA